MVSEARIRANKKYFDKTYDKITLCVPKGTKNIISNNFTSINSFCAPLIMAELERLGMIEKTEEEQKKDF